MYRMTILPVALSYAKELARSSFDPPRQELHKIEPEGDILETHISLPPWYPITLAVGGVDMAYQDKVPVVG